MEDTKFCKKCGERKDRSEFHKNKQQKDGLNPQCKICRSIYRNKYYKEKRLVKAGDAISYKFLINKLIYDPLFGLFSDKNTGRILGKKHNAGYISIGLNSYQYLAHRLAWFYMEGYWPENDIHHINDIKDDNRWYNLEHLNRSCHRKHDSLRKDNTSGVTGVYWDKIKNVWRVQVFSYKKSKFIGNYKKFINAVKARRLAEIEYNYLSCQAVSSAHLYLLRNGLL